MDKLSPQQRHANMAAIRGKNTKPEMIVRKGLWSRGFRYRLNSKKLPGHPDLVLRKYRTCIFVNVDTMVSGTSAPHRCIAVFPRMEGQ